MFKNLIKKLFNICYEYLLNLKISFIKDNFYYKMYFILVV